MNSSTNPASPLSSNDWRDTHHDILSVGQAPQRPLLSHLQVGSLDPLSHLFADTLPSDSLLNNVVLEPIEPAAEAPASVFLGPEAPLSQCILWQMQEDFYKNMGVQAWESSVPMYITSSTYIADTYSDMILAFIDDHYAQLDLSQPLYILELATGSGRFSHLILRELERKMQYRARHREVRIKYVMTDFTDANLKYWEQHEKFAPFVEKGLLDFAVLNPMMQNEVTLWVGGDRVCAETVKNPVVAIANYFFDSIKQDVFRVESKNLLEGLVRIERNLEGVDPDSAPHISQVKVHHRYRELRNDNYYDDARLNGVLKFYKHHIKDGTIIFPIGAFDVVRNLEQLSGNRLMLLSSDKAYACYEHMICFYEHQYAQHDGAFSYMVNYDAIGRFFENAGGHYFHTTGQNLGLQTVCLLRMDGAEAASPEHLTFVFREKVDRSNPITSITTLLPDGRPVLEQGELDRLIAHIRLHLCDPRIFGVLGQQLVDLIPHSTYGQQQDLLKLVGQAMDNFYYCPGEGNLPFWASQIYFHLQHFQESLDCLDQTIRFFGMHEALLFLKGQNYEKLSQWAEAASMYEQALSMQPDFDDARTALQAIAQRVK